MHITADSLDDLLRDVYSELLTSTEVVSATKGTNIERFGALLVLTNPRARLSRSELKGTLFSCLGELCWYLSASDDLDFIQHYIPNYKDYSDDGETIYGAYGPRFYKTQNDIDQISRICNLLTEKPSSRRAVIQLFDADDLTEDHLDVPCTCTIQCVIRDRSLSMLVYMRSNDAYKGLPHDIFSFTMLQEILARKLGVDIGEYKHAVGSLHLYDDSRDLAETYLKGGWHENICMPSMPIENPDKSIETLLHYEKIVREKSHYESIPKELDPYWADLIRLLQTYQVSKQSSDLQLFQSIEQKMESDIYKPYIEKRLAILENNK